MHFHYLIRLGVAS